MAWMRVPQKVWQAAVILLLTIMITLHLRILFMSSTSDMEEDFSEDKSLCNRPVVVNLNSKADVEPTTSSNTNHTSSSNRALSSIYSSKPANLTRSDTKSVQIGRQLPLNSSQAVMKWMELDPKLTKVVGHRRPEKGFLTIGIPSIKRINGPVYLLQTISSIIEKTSEPDKKRVVIVVFLADFDYEYNQEAVKAISDKFMPYINLGFLQIVQASKDFYPQLEGLKRNFNDKADRVTWRSKQVADFAFMFMYSQNISNYYIQIEDDVVCARNFVPHIQDFIKSIDKSTKKSQWAILEFSELGFIGKLFKSSDLHKLSQYMLTFYDEQPVDWLITYFRLSMAQKKVYLRKPTLFQHMGLKSSFDTSKDNKLKDKFFDGGTKRHQGDDPPAKVITKIKQFEKNSPELVYAAGSGFFWAVDLKAGDTIDIVFESSHVLEKIVVETGNSKSPNDVLKKGSIHVGEKLGKIDEKLKTVDCGAFTPVGEITDGKASLDNLAVITRGAETRCVRVRVDETQAEWVVFDQISVWLKK